jgi:hypothetical protein
MRHAKSYLTGCVGNHFHLLVKMIPENRFTDEDIQKRFVMFYGDSRAFAKGQIPYLHAKLSSLSEFMREIKVGFARYYNRRHNRRGYFWGDRFISVIVEKGETLINCLAYIELNPLRAGLVDRPEEYRWNSLGYHIQTKNQDNFLSLDFGLKEFGVLDAKERLRSHRRYVYEAGAINRPDRMQAKVLMIRSLQKNAKKNLKSAGSVVSGIASAILRIRASSDQGSLCLIITCGLNIYFTQSMKKNQNRSRAWMGCIR